jgi:hypothetical protein
LNRAIYCLLAINLVSYELDTANSGSLYSIPELNHGYYQGEKMIRTIEAVIDDQGHVRLTEPIAVSGVHRALVMVLDEPPVEAFETALLSESSLSDWSRSEENEAWSHLQ